MTITDFIAAHKFPEGNPLLGSPNNQLNLLYNQYGGIDRLDAIAVRITDTNREQLIQATSVVCQVDRTDLNKYLQVRLDDVESPIQRTVVIDPVTNNETYYIYVILDQTKKPILTNPAQSIYFSRILIEPESNIDRIQKNIYSVITNSTVFDRSSDYIQQSDRAETATNPINQSSIFLDRAVKAKVQDSLYSDTGWSNARYTGTPTTAAGYGGIEPTITGVSFTGTFYPSTIASGSIQGFPLETRVLKEYFYTIALREVPESSGKYTYTVHNVFELQKNKVQFLEEGSIWVQSSQEVFVINKNGIITSLINKDGTVTRIGPVFEE
jgi:hypothetical protein